MNQRHAASVHPRWCDGEFFRKTERAAGRCAVLAVMGASGLLFAATAQAADWQYRPVLTVASEYDDNPGLVEDDFEPREVAGAFLDAAIELRRRTPLSEILITPAVDISRYPGEADENTERLNLDVAGRYRGQRSDWRLFGRVEQVDVRDGAIEDPDFDDSGIEGVEGNEETDTGNLDIQRKRTRIFLRPRFEYSVTQRSFVTVSAALQDVDYDKDELGTDVDFTSVRASVGAGYRFSEKDRFSIEAVASNFETDPAAETGRTRNETDTYGARLRWDRSISEISRFYVWVGPERSDITDESPATPAERTEDTFSWETGYDRRAERSRIRFSLGQSTQPTGAGFVTERNRIRASFDYRLGPRWEMGVALFAQATTRLGGEDDLDDRDYLSGRINLAYRLTRAWKIEGNYNGRFQDEADRPGDAFSNAVYIGMRYEPPLRNR